MNCRHFGLTKSFALVLLLLAGWNCFAGEAQLKKIPWGKYSAILPLKMPRYETWKTLAPDARESVITQWQDFLLSVDTSVRGDDKTQALEWLFELWLEKAEAGNSSQPYCINQGVVKPLADCETSLGHKMHDFNTNDVLSKLGPASECPSGEKPCSPAFGFTSEGRMFCSSKNLTRDCAKKSKQPGSIPLAKVLISCSLGSPGVPKVDCKSLIEFFDKQMEAVENLCKDAPRTWACGVLKQQMRDVLTEKEENRNALERVAATSEAAKMTTTSAPCPPDKPARTSKAEPAAVAQNPSESGCVKKELPKALEKPTFRALMAQLINEKEQKPPCAVLQLPEQRKIAFVSTKDGEGLLLQGGPDSKAFPIDEADFFALEAASNLLLEPPYKVHPKDLLSSYFPKEELKDVGKKSELPSRGWTSANGTKIRYTIDTAGKDVLFTLAIQTPGSAKEHISQLNLGRAE